MHCYLLESVRVECVAFEFESSELGAIFACVSADSVSSQHIVAALQRHAVELSKPDR